APIAVPAVALPAASGPATPRIAPWSPNWGSLRRLSRLRSVAYAIKVGTSAPPTGITPKGTPKLVPRNHAGNASLNAAQDRRARATLPSRSVGTGLLGS